MNLFNVFVGGFVEGFDEGVSHQNQNARLLGRTVTPKWREVFGVIPGGGVVHGGVGFLDTNNVCLGAKFPKPLHFFLLNKVKSQQPLGVPRCDAVCALAW